MLGEGCGCGENVHAGLCVEIRRVLDGAASPRGKKIVGGDLLLRLRRGGEGEFDDDLGASLGTIAGCGATAMSTGDGTDKGQAEAVALRVATLDAVSYTHLDVYKRQGLGRAGRGQDGRGGAGGESAGGERGNRGEIVILCVDGFCF